MCIEAIVAYFKVTLRGGAKESHVKIQSGPRIESVPKPLFWKKHYYIRLMYNMFHNFFEPTYLKTNIFGRDFPNLLLMGPMPF